MGIIALALIILVIVCVIAIMAWQNQIASNTAIIRNILRNIKKDINNEREKKDNNNK